MINLFLQSRKLSLWEVRKWHLSIVSQNSNLGLSEHRPLTSRPLCLYVYGKYLYIIVKVKNHSTKKKRKKETLLKLFRSSYFYSLILHRENVTNPELPQTYITATSCPLAKSQTVFLWAWPCFSSQNRFPTSDLLLLLLSRFGVSDSVWPIDGSPPGSLIPGILQARILEWAAISLSKTWKWKVKVKSLSRVRPLATPWTSAF